MRQVLQDLSSGATTLDDVPTPTTPAGGLLIQTRRSLISAGTERMLVDFGRAGWLDKALQQPTKVRQVWDKVRTDGLLSTLDAVRSKLGQPLPLGYCNAGVVVSAGKRVSGFVPGDRVASNGPHAELVAVPRNLCARVPDGVSDDEAAFAVLGAIALQGVRLANPTLGECVVVSGLGLIGLITVQLLRATGCRVLGIDPDGAKASQAKLFGAEVVHSGGREDAWAAAEAFSRGRGVDAVVITAATKSSEPVSLGARMCRKRGRIVLVGVTGLELDRADFYEKELTFQVSCSYGPGRYDPSYETEGHDYPAAYVRWTEQRNFEAVLDMMAAGRLDVKPLITHRFAIGDVPAAYDLLASAREPYLGIMLDYDDRAAVSAAGSTVEIATSASPPSPRVAGEARFAVIGAGNYAGRVLIPAFAAAGANLYGLASAGGVSAAHYACKFGFSEATTDAQKLIGDSSVGAVVVATRHDSHARFVCQALDAGKHVFVEKPLALSSPEVDEIEAALARRRSQNASPLLMVGFNRRFAPHIRKMKSLLETTNEPKSCIITVNAGAIPASHWTQNAEIGGGRIIGEGCHFVDLARFLVGSPITRFDVLTMGRTQSGNLHDDKATLTLGFADGSSATIIYLANGHKSFPKERIEVFCAGRILALDNFRVLTAHGWTAFKGMRTWRQDKGQAACAKAFVQSIKSGGSAPIPLRELLEVARVTIALGERARG